MGNLESGGKQEFIKKLADRLMGWKLPKEFSPDAGISFDGRGLDARGYPRQWPTGTNLLSVDQAKQMFEYLLDGIDLEADAEPVAWMATSDNDESYLGFDRQDLYREVLRVYDMAPLYVHPDPNLAKLQAENEALKKDVERYRWLRECDNALAELGVAKPSTLDNYIDAAIAEQTKKEGA